MFESISKRFQKIFRNVRGVGRLSEKNVAESLREVRLALLEADVNFRVVKQIIEEVKAAAMGDEVISSIKPGQQFIKLIHEHLIKVMTSADSGLSLSGSPAIIMLIGLQGAGKTTAAGKLAYHLIKQGHHPLLAACDVNRPAAARQLEIVGQQAGAEIWLGKKKDSALKRAQDAIKYAPKSGSDVVILDTSGRLHIDEAMMDELVKLKEKCCPGQVLLVLDAMTGQDAVTVAGEFDQQVGIDGAILTKLDGDARGGAAISLAAVTGKPIKFAGVGERVQDLDNFEPERMASRILGMGDVLGLVAKAAEAYDEAEALQWEQKLRKAAFTLEDFRGQLARFNKMGSWESLSQMLPASIPSLEGGEGRFRKMTAILDSMTPKERHDPSIIGGSRRERIARGSGTSVREVNQLLKQFAVTKKMMTKMGKLKGAKSMKLNMGGVNWPLS